MAESSWLGAGMAEKARKKRKSRGSQIDAAVDAMSAGQSTSPKGEWVDKEKSKYRRKMK
jgi:hypothetical protein